MRLLALAVVLLLVVGCTDALEHRLEQTPTPVPTATPIPAKVLEITSDITSQADAYVEENGTKGLCRIDDEWEATINWWQSKSLPYLRAFYEAPEFQEDDVLLVLAWLEHERGRYARLCADLDE